MKKKLNLILFVCTLLFINNNELFAQRTIGEPGFINNSGTISTEVCSIPTSTFRVIATLSPGNALPSDNEFILQLSDPLGGFDDPQELSRVNTFNNGSDIEQDIVFSDVQIPEGTNSDTYRIRVFATGPGTTSPASSPLPIHYYRNDLILRINNAEKLTLCNVTNFVRTITIAAINANDGSDVNLDDIKFQWFRGAYPGGTLIPNETGISIDFTQNDIGADGTAAFYAQVDLGGCNSQLEARTNNLNIELIDPDDVTILGGPVINFCPQDANKVLNASETNFRNDYQWFKDGEAIPDAIRPSYDLPDNNFAGQYTLEIVYSADCTLTTLPVTVVNDGSTITVPLLENLIILPQETLALEVTTNAPVSPATSTYQWFRDTSPLTGILILSEPTISINAGNPGTYSVDILADDSCISMLNSTTNIYSPIAIGIDIGPSDDFTCEDSTVTLEIKDMFGFTQSGSGAPPQISLTENQLSLFTFEWFINDEPSGVTERTLDVNTADENANYTLRANLITGEFVDIVSNELTLSSIPSNLEIQASSTTLPVGGSVTLSVQQNPSYTYEWFSVVNGTEELIAGASGNTITVTEEGIYFVRISSGICAIDTPTVQIGNPPGLSELIPNVITPGGNSANNEWVLPSIYAEADVEVTIYSQRGTIDFQKSGGYSEDWPANSASGATETLYFYIITKSNSVVKKGTITVMR